MPTPYSFIIIKGKAEALHIEFFKLESNGTYAVRFKNNPTFYHYRNDDVEWIKESQNHDVSQCKVYVGGVERYGLAEIRSFQQGEKRHWRITYRNGCVRDYMHGTIKVDESCISDKEARNVFEFLRRVAQTNELGKDDTHEGILSSIYGCVPFISPELAIAPYLNPMRYKVDKRKSAELVFPFGCNASQIKAITAAFENQISVIQGPPGTGKTQTILNIIANLVIQEKTVLVVSNNNSATANVLNKLEKYKFDFIAATLGSNANKLAFIENQKSIPEELQNWAYTKEYLEKESLELAAVRKQLEKVFRNQEIVAHTKQVLADAELEWEHFKKDNDIGEDTFSLKKDVSSSRLISLWLQYQAFAENEKLVNKNLINRLWNSIRWRWANLTRKFLLGLRSELNKENLQETIVEIQSLFYKKRISELKYTIALSEAELKSVDANLLSKSYRQYRLTS